MYCLMLSHAPPQRYNRIRVYETIRRMRKKQGFLRGGLPFVFGSPERITSVALVIERASFRLFLILGEKEQEAFSRREAAKPTLDGC